MASCLRTVISIEVHLNAEHFFPSLSEGVFKRMFTLNEKNAFCQFSFEALHSSYFGDKISTFYKDAESNVINNTFSSFLCLLTSFPAETAN